MKHPKIALASGAALVVIVGGCTAAVVAGSPGTTVTVKTPAGTTTTHIPAGQSKQVYPVSTPSPSPTTGNLTGAVGTTFTVTGDNGVNDTQTTYDVTLTGVEQDATLAPYEALSNDADHMAAAEFTITGKTGDTSDDANNDATVIGSNGQQYTFSASSVTAGTNFNYGDYNAGPVQTVKGVVAFELPSGVSIKSVQWSPGFEGPSASWSVPQS